MSRAATFPLLAALALAVAGCASAPSVAPPAGAPATDEPFAVDGRLSARRGSEAVSITFTWTHVSPRDEFVVSTPLGQTVAELSSDASVPRAEMRAADGRRDVASDLATLSERLVGFPLPLEALAWWARGAPHADAPHTEEIDHAGRAGVLRQDGCEIGYVYADDAARRPSRLVVGCGELVLRILLDRWRAT
jgi:outer membrane lipoprotein LolB